MVAALSVYVNIEARHSRQYGWLRANWYRAGYGPRFAAFPLAHRPRPPSDRHTHARMFERFLASIKPRSMVPVRRRSFRFLALLDELREQHARVVDDDPGGRLPCLVRGDHVDCDG